jgi:hypothetical protein
MLPAGYVASSDPMSRLFTPQNNDSGLKNGSVMRWIHAMPNDTPSGRPAELKFPLTVAKARATLLQSLGSRR